jgi:CubicO group peptidase (beta-lactamase class C family)
MKKLFFLLFLLTAISGISQEISTGSIDSLVEKTIASFRVPGIAVGVVKDGKIIHAKGYGFNLE